MPVPENEVAIESHDDELAERLFEARAALEGEQKTDSQLLGSLERVTGKIGEMG